MFDGGYRLMSQQSYDISVGQRRYAIWKPGTYGQLTVWGWTLPDLIAKAQQLHAQSWRLVLLQAYTLVDGALRYDAVWNPGTQAQYAVYGWNLADFRQNIDMFNDGFDCRINSRTSSAANGCTMVYSIRGRTVSGPFGVGPESSSTQRRLKCSMRASGCALSKVTSFEFVIVSRRATIDTLPILSGLSRLGTALPIS